MPPPPWTPKGYQPNQPYFGAGGQGTVNGYTGNLILTETDLTLPGRGLDLAISRTYNSNLWKDVRIISQQYPRPSPDSLLKPLWLGYGWNMHFGRVQIPTRCATNQKSRRSARTAA